MADRTKDVKRKEDIRHKESLSRKKSLSLRENKKSYTQKKRKKAFIFVAELSVLTLLVAAAFYAPQIIFQVQDTILCGKTSFGARESMDVEALSTTYERSLSQRMVNFAEGLAEGEAFYVASQDLSIGEEIYDYLESDTFWSKDIFWYFMDIGMLNYGFWEGRNSIVVTDYKQYVIYSDDYAKGVNFILRYVEMRDTLDDRIYKVLIDAETETLYAFKAEYDDRLERPESRVINSKLGYDGILINLWYILAVNYEARFPDEVVEVVNKLGEMMGIEMWDINESSDILYDWEKQAEAGEVWAEWSIINEVTGYTMDNAISMPKENELYFHLPYGGEASLDVAVQIAEEDFCRDDDNEIVCFYMYPDFTMGFRQIYQLIPEFA